MAPSPPPTILEAVRTTPAGGDYQNLLSWVFPSAPFYSAQVARLLRADIPHRCIHGNGLVWVYRDSNRDIVGFGTLDRCNEYDQFTQGESHAYIPLLAVKPEYQGRGHGFRIVEHLIGEAALYALYCPGAMSDRLFLDVYTANVPAVSLYQKCGFSILNPKNTIPDPQEHNEPYFVMARSIASRPAG